jgi:type 1 glutamine amidotransferase
MHHFNSDMHVILALDPRGMAGPKCQRPSCPITWARMQAKGRVFCTALGHREDVWTNPQHQELILGGLRRSLGMVDTRLPANLTQATPGATQEAPDPPLSM